MIVRKLLIVLWVPLLTTFSLSLRAQTCTTLGQIPATAFPVCGSNKFIQNSVALCDDGSVTVPTPCGPRICRHQSILVQIHLFFIRDPGAADQPE